MSGAVVFDDHNSIRGAVVFDDRSHASSHVPAIDLGRSGDKYWRPVFSGYEWTKRWMIEQEPDVVILIYNDHASAFSLEFIAAITEEWEPNSSVGSVLECYRVLDELEASLETQSETSTR